MSLKSFYEEIGGGYDRAVSRFPSEEMLEKFVLKYSSEPSRKQLEQAILSGDMKAAFFAAHTLKGVAQNLGFEHLAEAASVLTEQLRGENAYADCASQAEVYKAHDEVIRALSKLQ